MNTGINFAKYFSVILILLFSQSSCAQPKLADLKESKVKEIPLAELPRQQQKIDIVTLLKFFVAGYSMKTIMKDGMFDDNVEKLWEIFEEIYDPELFHKRADDKIYFVIHNYKKKGKDGLEILVGYRIDDISKIKNKFSYVEIEAGTFAKEKAEGKSGEDIIKAWEKIYGSNLNRTYAYDIETYKLNDDFEVTDIELFISVKK